MTVEWKSPRKIEEEIHNYQRERFDNYMKLVDDGVYPDAAIAIAALRDEINGTTVLNPEVTQ